MTQVRFELDDYSVRVLDVVKGKFGLKNRNEALSKFIKDNGGEFIEPKFNEEYLKELDLRLNEHIKKYGIKSKGMSIKELDELLEL